MQQMHCAGAGRIEQLAFIFPAVFLIRAIVNDNRIELYSFGQISRENQCALLEIRCLLGNQSDRQPVLQLGMDIRALLCCFADDSHIVVTSCMQIQHILLH
ncbi:hypothetical protein D3C74_369130 [compost metagenome]